MKVFLDESVFGWAFFFFCNLDESVPNRPHPLAVKLSCCSSPERRTYSCWDGATAHFWSWWNHKQEVHGRPEPVSGVLDLLRGLQRPHIVVVRSTSSIEVGVAWTRRWWAGRRSSSWCECHELTYNQRSKDISSSSFLWALKFWRHGPERNQSYLGHDGLDGHVVELLDLEAILEVDGGKVFEQLEGLQHVRCHEHIDVGTETVNWECLRKHQTAWHGEQELQSNLWVQRREFLHSSGNVKLSHSELQIVEAHVVQRLVVQQHALIHIAGELVEAEDHIVPFHHRVGHFGWRSRTGNQQVHANRLPLWMWHRRPSWPPLGHHWYRRRVNNQAVRRAGTNAKWQEQR